VLGSPALRDDDDVKSGVQGAGDLTQNGDGGDGPLIHICPVHYEIPHIR
jgi:hypothetical protein